MKTKLVYLVALAVALALPNISFADYTGSSGDAGTFDVGTDFDSSIIVPVNEIITTVVVSVNIEHSWVGDVTGTITHVESGFAIDLIPTALSDSSNLGSDSGGDVLSPAPYSWGDLGSETIGTAAGAIGGTDEIAPGLYLASDGTATGAGSMTGTFAGDTTLGEWVLHLEDSAGGDDGNVDGWEISFESTAIPEPSSMALIGVMGLACFMRRRRR